jgi:hypothetical protein
LEIASVTIDVPADGFLFMSFSGTQYSHVILEGGPPALVHKRYRAKYGLGLDDDADFDYAVTSSAYDPTAYDLGEDNPYLAANAVSGNTVMPVSAGQHEVHLLTDMTALDSGADNTFKDISLTAVYFQLGGVVTVPPPDTGEGGTETDEFLEDSGTDR